MILEWSEVTMHIEAPLTMIAFSFFEFQMFTINFAQIEEYQSRKFKGKKMESA